MVKKCVDFEEYAVKSIDEIEQIEQDYLEEIYSDTIDFIDKITRHVDSGCYFKIRDNLANKSNSYNSIFIKSSKQTKNNATYEQKKEEKYEDKEKKQIEFEEKSIEDNKIKANKRTMFNCYTGKTFIRHIDDPISTECDKKYDKYTAKVIRKMIKDNDINLNGTPLDIIFKHIIAIAKNGIQQDRVIIPNRFVNNKYIILLFNDSEEIIYLRSLGYFVIVNDKFIDIRWEFK